ncbi:MAG: family oligoendopeptidase [Flavipsychrobacter sp.]|jgi:oligoendopeptidase F|nr:family oligoendopeptidase [Flavipsychrobacter sp.]
MNETIAPIPRRFLPQDFTVTTWEVLKPYFEELKARPINKREDLADWLSDVSELEAVISEDASWRQIKMTCDTTNQEYEQAFTYFCLEIEPKMKPYFFELNKKLLASPYMKELDESMYYPYLRSVKNSVDLYREENIPIQAEMSVLAQSFGVISGKMTITLDDKEYTLQQAAKFLQNPDRNIRETVFRKISERRLQDREQLTELFNKLVERRQKVAANAGFENYRDYKFRELGRFDYSPADCFAFHDAVREHILPLQKKLVEHRKQRLGLDVMRPWDGDAEPAGTQPLHPFETGKELADKTITVFNRLRPFFADCINTMVGMNRLDLESRKGKAPGGYNCPLAETGVPFIFMNAAGTMGDLITMMHEGGHAVHSFLSHPLPLSSFKEYPMEIAELASMSMELFSMEHWDVFFSDQSELHRAQLEELERVISVLPWIATIDKYQHWIYTTPNHTEEQRKQQWLAILDEFSTGVTDWSGFEDYRAHFWQKQLHLFEVPFYYIEYGIAQLGAIAMWRQYRQNKDQALDNYMKALSLGYTKTLKELYDTAGIKFDFSPAYVAELGTFVKERLGEMGVS